MIAAVLSVPVMHQLRLFFVALQFFTRVPVPRWVGFDADWLHHASRYFPAVGIVVGAVVSTVYALAGWLWPQPVAVLLSTIAGIWLTGAFHEDGFADMCDGFGGGMTPERVREVKQDERIAAPAPIAIIRMLGLQLTTPAMLPPMATAPSTCAPRTARHVPRRLHHAPHHPSPSAGRGRSGCPRRRPRGAPAPGEPGRRSTGSPGAPHSGSAFRS